MKMIWRKGKIPQEWRRSIMMPIYKTGKQDEIRNYRSISLLCTAYKIHAEILKNRLEEEVEEEELVLESQAGFRKGRSAIDNIFCVT